MQETEYGEVEAEVDEDVPIERTDMTWNDGVQPKDRKIEDQMKGEA